MQVNCAHTKLVDIDLLVPNPLNPNKHPEKQIELLAKIMKHQGWRSPIVVSTRSGFITKGHGRLQAARLNGWGEVPVDLQDYASEADEYADMVADNKIAELSQTDLNMVIDGVKGLGADFDFDLLGIPDFKLPEVLPPQGDPDDAPGLPHEAVTKRGDVWQIGRHRLMCGDATMIDDVLKLMSGARADMVFTDPPYNIGFAGSMSNTTKNGVMIPNKGANQKHDEIINDRMSAEEFQDFMLQVLSNITTVTNGAWYICFGSQTLDQLLVPLRKVGMNWKSIIIWQKNQATLSGKDYKSRYEPIAYGRFNDEFHGERFNLEDIWEFQRTLKNDLHPTMKPVPLIENAINNSSKPGGTVLDLFGGSGSTLIASEATGRTNFTLELDPRYCDVIVARWEKYTGHKAELITNN